MNKLIYLLLFCLSVITAGAQMKVGNNPTIINANSVLEIESTNKGLLIPRMALTSTSSPAPLSAHVAGMLIYNTATGGPGSLLTAGFYYNDGTEWVKISNQTDPVVVFSVNANPNTGGTTFSPNVPSDPTALYTSSIDGSVWKYSLTYSSFITYTPPASTTWYLAGGTTDALSNKTASIYRTGAMGIGAKTSPDPSAILDVNSTTQGFLPPVMTMAQRTAIAAPANGLIVYCVDCNSGDPCLSVNDGTAATPSWDCISIGSASVTEDCGNSSVNGVYVSGTANTASNTVSFKVINNSFSSIGPIDFSNGWVTLSGTGAAGLTVGTGTPTGGSGTISGYTVASGGTATLTYLLNGTPTTAGNFTAVFAKLGLSCSKTGTVNPPTPVVNCSGQTITGLAPVSYTLNGTTYTAGTISIPYTIAANTAYGAETLSSNGLTVTRSAGTFTAPSGVITYTVSGTYTGTSYLPCTFSANIGGAACTLIVGTSRDFKTGTYTTSAGTYGTCAALSNAALTDNNYTTGYGNSNTTVNQTLQIDLGGTYFIDRIKFGGGNLSCWGNGISNFDTNAHLLFEYWNGTAWVTLTTTPAAINSSTITDASTTIFTLPSIISTSKIRIRNTVAAWWGVDEFYPMVFY